MGHLTRVALFLYVVALLVMPERVLAQEHREGAQQPFILESALKMQLNIIPESGNARIFPPENENDSALTVSPGDRRPIVTRNYLQLRFRNIVAGGEFLFNFYSQHQIPIHSPESAGMEATLLFPVSIFKECLWVGLYHDSAHNLDLGDFGSGGSDLTGVHVRKCLYVSNEARLEWWSTRSIIKSRKNPYFYLADAHVDSRAEFDTHWGAFGFSFTRYNGQTTLILSPEVAIADGDTLRAASFQLSATARLRVDETTEPFLWLEYHRNLTKREMYGTSEILFGVGVILHAS